MSSRTNPRSATDTLINIFLLMLHLSRGDGLLTVAKFAVYILGEGERVERWKEGMRKWGWRKGERGEGGRRRKWK
ncbi:hypothetical protein E2320_006218 [Naja naja]|nr:hypothetical protein E2320_006218 [Naja naja]